MSWNAEHVRDLSNTMRTRDLPLFGAPGVNKSLEDLILLTGATIRAIVRMEIKAWPR